MSKRILKLQTEKLKLPIEKTSSVIKKLSSNPVTVFKSPFEQFITTQPGITDLVNHICQSLTYNDSKSANYVTKEFQLWISNSELFRLAHEADAVIEHLIAAIKDSCFRKHFGRVLTDFYKSIIGDCNADMLKILVEILKDYLEDVVNMDETDSDTDSDTDTDTDTDTDMDTDTDDLLFAYENYTGDLRFSFEIAALFVGFRFTRMGFNVQEMTSLSIIKELIGTYVLSVNISTGKSSLMFRERP